MSHSILKAIPLAMLALLIGGGAISAEENKKIVRVDSVRKEPLRQTVPVVGRLVARQSGVIASRTSGPVEAVFVYVGDRVKEGQVVAKLVSDSLSWQVKLGEADVAAATAARQEASAQVTLLKQEMKRLERLRKSAAFSQARYEDKRQGVIKAQGAYAEAQASLNRAKANLELMNIKLANAEVKAPYSGVVTKTHTESGAYLSAGASVITLVDDENLEVEADVPSGRTVGLTSGLAVTLRVGTQTALQAIVRAVVPEENPLTRTRPVRFTLSRNASLVGLASNQSVMLDIPAGKAGDVVTVHKDAVLSRKGKNIVFVVTDGKAMIRPFESGQPIGGRFQVLKGLKPGEIVVVRGNEGLHPGEAVQVAK
ncbi:MAG: efflux RND transporter periplasmic adaptor subunit [Alphaproteobacteria bacterium]|nr:efflux RND transporter periplasmic adaptor subunit [Rhodospirillales bacterium]MCW9046287.1 efflux RND transporter periplasmic adaptor subunit [Alphaproteobacteria bacterium]